MLSIFPELLTYQVLGITIIRVLVALAGIYIGFKIIKARNEINIYTASIKMPLNQIIPWFIAVLFLITGAFMFIGLYTQIACIVLAFLFLKVLIIDSNPHKNLGNSSFFYIFMIILSLTFLVLGPGAFAFDLPL